MPQPKTLNNAIITDDQCVALRKFAAHNGLYWKSILTQAWNTDDYPNTKSCNDKELLQQLRNDHGPFWLKGVITKKLRLLTDIK